MISMRFDIVTIFPEMFRGPLTESIMKRAVEKQIIEIALHDLRDFAEGPHRQIDDAPFGGGGGMVFKPEPIFRAVEKIKEERKEERTHIILLSPQGRRFDQRKAKELLSYERLILLCGRYEGVDERVKQHCVDEEISIGDFVLTGGELAAMVIIDSITRLLPGAIGDAESAAEDSFSAGILGYPQYTRPADFRGMTVPEVLLSGNHEEIKKWRKQKAIENTLKKRPDLIEKTDKRKDSK